MVDAGMGIFGRETTLAGTSAPATARPTMTVDEYAAFAAARPCAPAQSPAWINAVWGVANQFWNDTDMTPADAVAALKAAQTAC